MAKNNNKTTSEAAPIVADDMDELLPEVTGDLPDELDESLPEAGLAGIGIDTKTLKKVQLRRIFYNFDHCAQWPVHGLLLAEVLLKEEELWSPTDPEVKARRAVAGTVKMPRNYAYLVELLSDTVCARKVDGKVKKYRVKKGERIFVPVKQRISDLRQRYLAIGEDVFPLIIKANKKEPIPGTMRSSWDIDVYEAGPPVSRIECARDTVGMITQAGNGNVVNMLPQSTDTSFDPAKLEAEKAAHASA